MSQFDIDFVNFTAKLLKIMETNGFQDNKEKFLRLWDTR